MGGLYLTNPCLAHTALVATFVFYCVFFIKDFINASSFINIFYFCQAPTMKCTHYD